MANRFSRMKKIFILFLLTIVFVGSAAAQMVYYTPCVVDVQEYPRTIQLPRWENGVLLIPKQPQPIWEPIKGTSSVYKTNPYSYWQIPVSMPVAGHCVGSFESYDDRGDIGIGATDALGRYAGTKQRPSGNIEILIMDEINFVRFQRNQAYRAEFSSGRRVSGEFSAPLRPGFYRLVINNNYSLAYKSVTFTLGRIDPMP